MECDWNREVKSNEYFKQFLASDKMVESLSLRDAFFGGGTNAVHTHHVANEDQGEQIKYVDVTFVYPCVNKIQQYPIGDSIIITNPQNQDIHAYSEADVIPPYLLYHLVLLFRHRAKLTLPLYRTCMEDMNKDLFESLHHCPHSPEERLLRSTWCPIELVKAVEVGFRIVHIHEVWHFPEEKHQEGLFADYVNTWLKIKRESALYPGWAQTTMTKKAFP